ncbi:MAG: response regulator transcription factor [Prolixibacteraceae bacterium]|nr:response regulator transcription factor [Prolixibacteraceae bacterium]
MNIRIMIVEDHAMFREGLHYILNNIDGFDVVGEAASGNEFLTLLNNVQPDIVLMDIDLPGMDGAEASRQALIKDPDLKILCLSMHSDYAHYQKMMDAGSMGFVLKNAGIVELTEAIRQVVNGKLYFSQELLLNIIHSKTPDESANMLEQTEISARELEVLELICKGMSNKEIADQLYISIKTVEGHKSKLMIKTDTRNTVSLVLYALRNKLVNS